DGSWTLSGEKIWITNGGITQLYTVFARTDAQEGKMTAFIVEAAWPGISYGPHEDKMGVGASSTTTVSFADVRVPAADGLGEAGMSKVSASDAFQRAAHEATQIAAGNGFMREFPYEQITRDSRILSIFEGTNEILRLYIALSGLKDVGANLDELNSTIGDIF